MRPLRLSMQAFGPFAGTEVVDFRALEHSTLFLIHGPTGAGKTTILDAISFALFGESSGHERSGAQMRSQFAAADLFTEVVLDFRFRGRVYRVRRSPQQTRPKLRGEGFREVGPEAAMWERTEDVEPGSDGKHIESQPTKVSLHIEKMLGFSAGQFRQVVMLPQGQFRRVLTASSSDREKIFEKLFSTNLYRTVADNLKERYHALTETLREQQDRTRLILETQGADGLEALEALDVRAAGELAQSDRVADLAKQARAAKRELRDVAKQAQAKLDEQREAKEGLAQLEQTRPQVEAKRVRASAAGKAAPLAQMLPALEKREQDVTRVREAHARTEREANEGAAAQRVAAERLVAERARLPEREAATRRLAQLSALQGEATLLNAAADRREQARAERKRVHVAAQRAQSACAAHEVVLVEVTQELERVRTCAATRADLRLALERARLRQRAETECSELSAKHTLVEKLAREAAEAEDAARRAHNGLQRELEGLEQRWRAGQAMVLARELVDGEPCSVCGSMDHPRPASTAEVPEAAELETLKRCVDDAQRALVEAAAAQASARKDLEVTSESLLDAQRKRSELPAEEEGAVDLQALEASLAQAQHATEAAPTREQALATAQAEALRLATAGKACDDALQQADKALALAEQAWNSAAERLPEGLRTAAELGRAQAEATALDEVLKKALSTAVEAERVTVQRAAKAEEALEAAKAELGRGQQAAKEERMRFDAARVEAGFAEPSLFERARADVPQLESLGKAVQSFDVGAQAAAKRLERATKAADGVAAPDLPAVEGALRQAQDAYDEAVGAQAKLRQRVQGLRDALKKVREQLAGAGPLEVQQRRVGHLSEVANGRNERNLSFQRFVLAVLLDDVLRAATERLHRMSRGRYQLVRNDEVGHRAKAAGLELYVIDAHSGTRRPVATLSGGESFLAALSLSLGLVDVVQAYSGGAELDALFIDEGFGSLDDESLEQAIDVLADLNGAGRLIGIISHVKELRERIDARLEVRPTDSGSTTVLSVG